MYGEKLQSYGVTEKVGGLQPTLTPGSYTYMAYETHEQFASPLVNDSKPFTNFVIPTKNIWHGTKLAIISINCQIKFRNSYGSCNRLL